MREAATPKYLYHATFTKYVPSIKKMGLVQFASPSNWVKGKDKTRYNEDAGIFAFEHPRDAFGWAFHMQFEHGQPTSIIRIKVGDTWEDDPSHDPHLKMGKGRAVVSHANIKPESVVDSFDLKDFSNPASLGITQDEWFARIVKALES